MASEPPPGPPAQATARPKYLVVALVAALVFGAGGWTEGCARLQYYRGAAGEVHLGESLIHDEEARANVETLARRYTDAEDDARGRGVPFSAATFVLGAALLALASRGLAGRANNRAVLMQVVAAQAILAVAQFFVMRDVREAELDYALAGTLAHLREAGPERFAAWAPIYRGLRDYGRPTWLALRTLASAMIIVALTRQRSRQFFDAAADTAPER